MVTFDLDWWICLFAAIAFLAVMALVVWLVRRYPGIRRDTVAWTFLALMTLMTAWWPNGWRAVGRGFGIIYELLLRLFGFLR